MDTKQWNDIGYNFLIGGDGNVYEGRGWGKHGAHSSPYNSKSIGICIIGNFTSKWLMVYVYVMVTRVFFRNTSFFFSFFLSFFFSTTQNISLMSLFAYR